MGSDETHFNVSVGSDGQSHKTVSTNHNLFWRERRAEAVSNRGPSAYQPNALPLGQTGSHVSVFPAPSCSLLDLIPATTTSVCLHTQVFLAAWLQASILLQVYVNYHVRLRRF